MIILVLHFPQHKHLDKQLLNYDTLDGLFICRKCKTNIITTPKMVTFSNLCILPHKKCVASGGDAEQMR